MHCVQGKWGLALVTSTHGTLLLMLLLLPIFRQLGCVNHRHARHTNQNRSLNISLIGGRRQQSTYTYPSQIQTERQLCRFPPTHASWDCSCVCVCALVWARESNGETVRVFKMLCLWAQYVTSIIHYNSFLTSTSSHCNFRLLQCTPSFIHCKLYENISP